MSLAVVTAADGRPQLGRHAQALEPRRRVGQEVDLAEQRPRLQLHVPGILDARLLGLGAVEDPQPVEGILRPEFLAVRAFAHEADAGEVGHRQRLVVARLVVVGGAAHRHPRERHRHLQVHRLVRVPGGGAARRLHGVGQDGVGGARAGGWRSRRGLRGGGRRRRLRGAAERPGESGGQRKQADHLHGEAPVAVRFAGPLLAGREARTATRAASRTGSRPVRRAARVSTTRLSGWTPRPSSRIPLGVLKSATTYCMIAPPGSASTTDGSTAPSEASPTTTARLASCSPAASISDVEAVPSSVRIASGPRKGFSPSSGRAVSVWLKSRHLSVPSSTGWSTNSDATGIDIAPWPPGLPRRSRITARTWCSWKRPSAFLSSPSTGCTKKMLKATTPTSPVS